MVGVGTDLGLSELGYRPGMRLRVGLMMMHSLAVDSLVETKLDSFS